MQGIIYLLFANALFHLISFMILLKQKSPDKMGVFAFILINAGIGVLLLMGLIWAKWLALIFPVIGFTGLASTIKKSSVPKLINYAILILDASIVVLVISILF